MKVCHVTSSHGRYDGRIFLKECTSLAKKYDVVLLVSDDLKDEIKNNVHIKSTGIKPKNKYERFFVVPQKLKKYCLDTNADVYQFHDPELMDLAYFMKKKGKKVIFDYHEDYLNAIEDKSWIPKKFKKAVKRYFLKKENKALINSDVVITVTNHIYDRLKIINDNTFMITNYPIVDDSIVSKNHNSSILCFAGGVSRQWLHENVIKAIEEIDVAYYLAGPTFNSYLEELKSLKGYSKVNYFGKISKTEVNAIYEKAGIGMALNDYVANVGYHYGSIGNTKIFEFMYAGLPIIGTDFVLWKAIIEKNKCGICVNPHNINEIKNAILYLKEHPKEAKQMGKNGHDLVLKKYNWQTQEKKLLKIYEELQ